MNNVTLRVYVASLTDGVHREAVPHDILVRVWKDARTSLLSDAYKHPKERVAPQWGK